jgi:hypothetical protein
VLITAVYFHLSIGALLYTDTLLVSWCAADARGRSKSLGCGLRLPQRPLRTETDRWMVRRVFGMMSRMLQIVSNVVLIAAIAYLTFLYQKVLAPFSEKYSEEKGRRLATREDFEEILREQRRMTNEIERIKSQVLDEAWLRQTILA